MGLKLTQKAWLNREAIKIKAILVSKMEHDAVYTNNELMIVINQALAKKAYTAPEMAAIRKKLIDSGVIEIV